MEEPESLKFTGAIGLVIALIAFVALVALPAMAQEDAVEDYPW
jgi:hypothetical protein